MRWKDSIVLTFDVDWAPDFAISLVSEQLIKRNIKSTWFITHESEEIKKLIENPLFEIGIHPNFNDGSTQGNSYTQVLDHMKKIAPEAVSVRTHGLVQSANLLYRMANSYGISIDSSIYLKRYTNIAPFNTYLGNKKITRIPFFWTEDEEMAEENPLFTLQDIDLNKPGLKVFDFHPIHLLLNSFSIDGYNKFKTSLGTRSIRDCEPDQTVLFINEGLGVSNLFEELLDYLEHKETHNLKDITECYNWEVKQ